MYRRGLTPLQMCVIYDNVPFAEFLVSRGANPDLVFYNNKSAKEMVMSSKNPALRNLFMGEGEFTMLPENVTHKILSYLPPKDLVTVRLCSKKHKVIVDKILSDYGYMSKYGNLYEKYMVYNAAVEALNETLDNANQNMGEWLKPIKTRDFVSLVSVDSQNPAFFAEYKIQISVVGSTGYGKTSFISTIRDGVFPIDPVPDRTHCVFPSLFLPLKYYNLFSV